MTLSLYLAQQERMLVNAFNNPAHFPVGISHPDHFPSFLQREHTIEYDQRVRNKRAFMRIINSSSEIEYWVHIDYTGYRKSFKRFLLEKHIVQQSAITSTWHADHLLSQAFARKLGVEYVRMCLLSKSQNLDYGRKFERNMVAIPQDSRPIFLLDYLCAMKVLGIPVPKDKADYETRKSTIALRLSSKGVKFIDNPELELDAYFKWWNVI
jgi:hypothetical protein